jgi:leader peptidase (prepilin peptidase)/N-methyltransferase
VEALSGLLAVGLALRFSGPELVIWSIATFVFVLISVIDARLKIIPDGLNSFIVFLGIISIIIASTTGNFGPVKGSLIGHHALLFGIRDNIWLNHFFGAGLALLLFVAVVIISRGRGMGLGDVKLAAAAGVLMGWPDIVFALMIAFISGSLWGIVSIFLGRKTMKSIIPFGPFIVLGIMVIALFGEPIFDSYFRFIDTLIT